MVTLRQKTKNIKRFGKLFTNGRHFSVKNIFQHILNLEGLKFHDSYTFLGVQNDSGSKKNFPGLRVRLNSRKRCNLYIEPVSMARSQVIGTMENSFGKELNPVLTGEMEGYLSFRSFRPSVSGVYSGKSTYNMDLSPDVSLRIVLSISTTGDNLVLIPVEFTLFSADGSLKDWKTTFNFCDGTATAHVMNESFRCQGDPLDKVFTQATINSVAVDNRLHLNSAKRKLALVTNGGARPANSVLDISKDILAACNSSMIPFLKVLENQELLRHLGTLRTPLESCTVNSPSIQSNFYNGDPVDVIHSRREITRVGKHEDTDLTYQLDRVHALMKSASSSVEMAFYLPSVTIRHAPDNIKYGDGIEVGDFTLNILIRASREGKLYSYVKVFPRPSNSESLLAKRFLIEGTSSDNHFFNYLHPHVGSEGELCMGRYEEMLNDEINLGHLTSIPAIVMNVLEDVTPTSMFEDTLSLIVKARGAYKALYAYMQGLEGTGLGLERTIKKVFNSEWDLNAVHSFIHGKSELLGDEIAKTCENLGYKILANGHEPELETSIPVREHPFEGENIQRVDVPVHFDETGTEIEEQFTRVEEALIGNPVLVPGPTTIQYTPDHATFEEALDRARPGTNVEIEMQENEYEYDDSDDEEYSEGEDIPY